MKKRTRFIDESLPSLDARFAGTGYALLTDNHDKKVWCVTSNCKVRLSIDWENENGHAITDVRERIASNPESGYLIAMKVSCDPPKPNSGYGWAVGIYDAVRIQSNGTEMAVGLALRPPRRGFIARLFGK